MRRPGRQLPALLCLLAPLIVLAWYGQAELGRLEGKVRRSLDEQARSRLEAGARDLERSLTTRVEDLWQTLRSEPLEGFTEATRTARGLEPALLDLFLLDAEAELIAPRPSPDPRLGLQFHQPSRDANVRAAEALETLGDPEGALARLAPLLEDETASRSGDMRFARARFQAGGLARRTGDLPRSKQIYESLRRDLDRSRRVRNRASRRTLSLLCSCALAEIATTEAGDGPGEEAAALLREIALGSRDDCPEALIRSIWERLAPLARDAAESLNGLEQERRRAREFADEYVELLAERSRRSLRSPNGSISTSAIEALYDGRSGLLVWRPVGDAEPRAEILARAAWVGTHLDLDRIAAELSAPDAEFVLEIDTGDSARPDGSQRGLGPFDIPLLVRPSDPERAFADKRRGFRNRTLLYLALVSAAALGAFALFRTTRKEAELAQAKVAFVSRVGHDLRTPLALIRMYAETLSLGRAEDPERRTRCSNVILRETDTLTRQIDRLLDAARRSRADFRFQPESLDVGDRIEQLVDGYQKHAEARGAEVRLAHEDGLVTEVDPSALDDSVANLIDNAIKYTPDEGASRVVDVEVSSEGQDVLIVVADRGIGVPERDRRRIFDDFQRGSNAGEVRGSGLGLHLVRQFAEAHAGTVSVDAREGGGSRFVLRLPLGRGTKP